ncbi:LLM class oxidoreductase [Flindersiella endophytica]
MRDTLGATGVWIGRQLGLTPAGEAREAAAEIEGLGYGSLWVSETPTAKDPFSLAAVLLAATERLPFGTGIANVWARDANATHGAAMALADAFPGRFLLGIGVSHLPAVARRGGTYEKPLQKMTSYLHQLDAVPYEGAEPAAAPPRVLAALRTKMLELARDHADGAHPYFTPPEHTARAREVLGAGPLLIPEQAVLLETDPTRARELGREHTQYYLALPNYRNNLLALGFTEDDLANGGSDKLVDAIVAWGSVDDVRTRIRAHLDAGADHVLLQPLAGNYDLAGAVAQLRELAPAVTTPAG